MPRAAPSSGPARAWRKARGGCWSSIPTTASTSGSNGLRTTLAGLEFVDREHVRATLAARDRAHPYRAPRLELAAEVVLRLGETCLTARAKDVSEGGIKVELAEPEHVGREASVIVPGMPPVAGRILWCRDGRAGISFERPLPFRSLIDCLTRQPAERPAEA